MSAFPKNNACQGFGAQGCFLELFKDLKRLLTMGPFENGGVCV